MAAKNGCSEAAQLLLAHGASVEARANVIFSFPPLHLSFNQELIVYKCLCIKYFYDRREN
jgi:ankyrin repeat protein